MIRVTFTVAVIAMGTPVMAQPVIDPFVVADKACAAFNQIRPCGAVQEGIALKGARNHLNFPWGGYPPKMTKF